MEASTTLGDSHGALGLLMLGSVRSNTRLSLRKGHTKASRRRRLWSTEQLGNAGCESPATQETAPCSGHYSPGLLVGPSAMLVIASRDRLDPSEVLV